MALIGNQKISFGLSFRRAKRIRKEEEKEKKNKGREEEEEKEKRSSKKIKGMEFESFVWISMELYG